MRAISLFLLLNHFYHYTDPTGTLITTHDFKGNILNLEYDDESEKWAFKYLNGETYSGDNDFVNNLSNALNTIFEGGETGAALVQGIAQSENICQIVPGDKSKGGKSGIKWNMNGAPIPTKPKSEPNATIDLGHELAHVEAEWAGMKFPTWTVLSVLNENTNKIERKEISKSEIFTTHKENLLRAENRLPLRTHYSYDNNGALILQILDIKTKTSLYYNLNQESNFKKIKNKSERYTY